MIVCISYVYGQNYSELAALAIPSLISYCAKHKYICDIKTIDGSNGYDYIRVEHTLELLKTYDAVFMMEGDFLITNHKHKIEDFIDEDYDFYICKDVNNYNGGSWVAKQSVFTKKWLESALAHRNKEGYVTEQNVFEQACGLKGFSHGIKTLGHPTINSIKYDEYAPSYGYIEWEKLNPPPTFPTIEEGNWTPDCFVCHLPGKPLKERIRIFSELKEHIIYE